MAKTKALTPISAAEVYENVWVVVLSGYARDNRATIMDWNDETQIAYVTFDAENTDHTADDWREFPYASLAKIPTPT